MGMVQQNYNNNALNTSQQYYCSLFTKNVHYKVQKFSLPELDLAGESIEHSSGRTYLPGQKVVPKPLIVEILLDESLDTWFSLYDLANEYNQLGTSSSKTLESDSILTMYDQKNKKLFEVILVASKLTNVSAVEFDLTQSRASLSCTLTIEYDYLKRN